MLKTIKELTEKGFVFGIMSTSEKNPFLTIIMYRKGNPEHTLTGYVLPDDADERIAAILRRLEEEFYERGWAERSLL